MKEDLKPLPEDTEKIKYSYGRYMKTKICPACRWFDHQTNVPFYLNHECCPECGEEIYVAVGRLKLKTTKFGLIFPKSITEVIGFEPKEFGTQRPLGKSVKDMIEENRIKKIFKGE